MLATLVDRPFHRPGWVYEEKYDGHRLLAFKDGARVRLLSRNGADATARFPTIAAAVARLPARSLILDGEAVAFDRRLVSRFQLLQRSASPVVYATFDCLALDRDLRREPLSRRRARLERVVADSAAIFPARRLAANGLAAWRVARRRRLEGMVAKDAASPYVAGRSRLWLKVKARQEEEFVIGGFTAPSGGRRNFGALLLGAYEGSALRHVGRVGTGFDGRMLESLGAKLRRLVRVRPPFSDPPREAGVTWLAPRLVAQVAFAEWTADGRLRHPVFLGLRDDKRPLDCRMPGARG